MLVLSRKTGEAIVLSVGGREVVVRVVAARSARVRLGIQADPEVGVCRGELVSRRAVGTRLPGGPR